MDHLKLVAAWGAGHLHRAETDREQAAVAMAVAAMQPTASQAQRIQWMADAAKWHPGLGPSLAHAVWSLPQTGLRAAFRRAWPKIKASTPLNTNDSSSLAISSEIPLQAPPILSAIARGNRQAVTDTLQWEGKPEWVVLPHSMMQNKMLDGGSTDGAPWLAWALWFQQWELAEDLLNWSSQETQESLDRSLFYLMQRFASSWSNNEQGYTAGDGTSRTIRDLQADKASKWIQTLVDLGANPHYRPRSATGYRAREMFIGRMDGLDQALLEAKGWEVKQGSHYLAHPDTAVREMKAGQTEDLPSSACLAFQHRGPIGWRRLHRPLGNVDEGERTSFEAIGEVFDQDFSKMACMWQNASSEQWISGIQALVFAHCDSLMVENMATRVHSWCPEFMLEGFAKADANQLASTIGDTPYCPWLDCIALHLTATAKNMDEIADFHGRAIQTMAGRLPGNADAFVRGLQRASAQKTKQAMTRFSHKEEHASVDEFLAIPGINAMLNTMDPGFIESFEAFAAMDRDMHAAWRALADPGPEKKSLSAQDMEQINKASQTLLLHRSVLPSLAKGVAPARAMPRM